MAINKVIYGNRVLLDLTTDTVTSSTLVQGATAHSADGSTITGTLVVQSVYKGAAAPSSALGTNGDIYIQE